MRTMTQRYATCNATVYHFSFLILLRIEFVLSRILDSIEDFVHIWRLRTELILSRTVVLIEEFVHLISMRISRMVISIENFNIVACLQSSG